MKQFITLALTCFFCAVTMGQERSIREITSFKIKNSGSLMDKNNDVDGYYFFYEVDKLKKGNREYAIKIMDNNLNDVATKSYIDQKKTTLVNSKFNNQNLMFTMFNKKDKNFKLVTFNREGDQGETISVPLDSNELLWLERIYQTGDFNLLFPVDNKGFIFNYVKKHKKIGYRIKYIPTDGGEPWDFNSPKESKEIKAINPIQANEDVIVAIETSKKSLTSKTLDIRLIVLDTNTGKLLFDVKFDEATNPRLITNAFITNDKKLIILGEYFTKGDNIFKNSSEGLFAKAMDLSGNELSDKKVSWKDDINKMMPINARGKSNDNTYIFFHDMIRTQDGTYYCIGEKYKKTANGFGIASSILGAALSGGRNISVNSLTQLTITDAVVFKFNEEFNLENIEVFRKGKSRATSITDFGSPQLNAHLLKSFGAFDYEFTQIDTDRDRFYANFTDYERLEGEKSKLAFKTILYSDGKLSEDKIYLENESDNTKFRVFPAKLGNVLLLEYNKKHKTIGLHLEKLNIQ